MFETLRIALVGEGTTDFIIIRAAVEAILGDRSFEFTLLQPEGSVAFQGAGDAGLLGGGWKGVYKWCLQSALRGEGRVSGDPLFISYDLLVVQVDADVAGEDPANHRVAPIPELAGILPCGRPCPPAAATTDPLRTIILSWMGESAPADRIVLCTPSKSLESWVIAAFFPNDREMARQGWECHPEPANRLGQQPVEQRFPKTRADYERRAPAFSSKWPAVAARLLEAARFHQEFLAAV